MPTQENIQLGRSTQIIFIQYQTYYLDPERFIFNNSQKNITSNH